MADQKKKKNPFQDHKEALRKKSKRADEEAAAIYESFVASFEADPSPQPLSSSADTPAGFVHGGTVIPGERGVHTSSGAAASGGLGEERDAYLPPPLPRPRGGGGRQREDSVFAYGSDKGGKTREMDVFLEELKQKHAEGRDGRVGTQHPDYREDLAPVKGSFDTGDGRTTNLFVGNIPPKVDEQELMHTFGRYGAIASVKIMWPRDDEQRRRGKNTGFVAFMSRAAAAAARDGLHNSLMHGFELNVGWGKAVTLPAIPLYAPDKDALGEDVQKTIPSYETGEYFDVAAPRVTQLPAKLKPGMSDIHVVIPPNLQVQVTIDTFASFVAQDGEDFEETVKQREKDNPIFSFLFQRASAECTYYTWKVFSLANGDTLTRWREDPFVMIEGGDRWIPPTCPEIHSKKMGNSAKTMEELERERAPTAAQRGRGRESGRTLNADEINELDALLESITMERGDIKEAMMFALDKADAAPDITRRLIESLVDPSTPVPTKVARLFLASDILHNSTAAAHNASRYRFVLQSGLPDVFSSFWEVLRDCPSRITAVTLKRHVTNVVRVWTQWFIFSETFVTGLQSTFAGGASAPTIPDAMKKMTEESAEKLMIYEEELADIDVGELTRRCRLAGLPAKGSRGDLVGRLRALQIDLFVAAEKKLKT